MSCKEISPQVYELIKRVLTPFEYTKTINAVYRGQVPMAALLLLEGEIQLKGRKNNFVIYPMQLIGHQELEQNKSIPYDVEVTAGSKVIIINRSDMLELIEKYDLASFTLFISHPELA